jgi:hypothetical protein
MSTTKSEREKKKADELPFNKKTEPGEKKPGQPPQEPPTGAKPIDEAEGLKSEINAEDIQGRIQKLAEFFPTDRFNYASPSRSISSVPAGHKIAVGVVTLRKAPSDDYFPVMEYDKATRQKVLKGYCVSSEGRKKLAALAGITTLESCVAETERNADGLLMRVKHRQVAKVINFDGTDLVAAVSKTIDRSSLIDLGKSEHEVKRIMAYAFERAETGCLFRMVGYLLGLENIIQPHMTSKPWIVLKLTWNIDPTNPDERRYLMDRQYGTGGVKGLLYGHGTPLALPDPMDITDAVEVQDLDDKAEGKDGANDDVPY